MLGEGIRRGVVLWVEVVNGIESADKLEERLCPWPQCGVVFTPASVPPGRELRGKRVIRDGLCGVAEAADREAAGEAARKDKWKFRRVD